MAQMSDTRRYPAQVFWSDEDEGYIALAPDLPGCSAFGDSQEEAIAELQHAITAWREAAQKAGNPVPKPSQPASDYSGKLLLRMPKSLHAQLARAAETEGVSLNQYLIFRLSASTSARADKASLVEQLADIAANRAMTSVLGCRQYSTVDILKNVYGWDTSAALQIPASSGWQVTKRERA